MQQNEWSTIPVLPYISMEDTLSFWQHLGFAVTYRQRSPYQYAVVERNGSQLHFTHQKEAGSSVYYGCLMMIHNAEAVHQAFCLSLKAAIGKVPLTGLPRISRMKPGQTRFTVTDPSGNSVICIQQGKEDSEQYESVAEKERGKPARIIALAARLRDYKEDHKAAARALDNMLRQQPATATPDEQAEALVMRAALARVLNDQATAEGCQAQLAALGIASHKIQEWQQKHDWKE
jgi:hypothetical protein